MLRVVEAQVAVARRSVESAHKARTIPVGEVLDVRIGVLESHNELETAFHHLGVALMTRHIAAGASRSASLSQTLGVSGRANIRRRIRRFAVGPTHEAAVPSQTARINLIVLQTA